MPCKAIPQRSAAVPLSRSGIALQADACLALGVDHLPDWLRIGLLGLRGQLLCLAGSMLMAPP